VLGPKQVKGRVGGLDVRQPEVNLALDDQETVVNRDQPRRPS
jgi:hypothetical protein